MNKLLLPAALLPIVLAGPAVAQDQPQPPADRPDLNVMIGAGAQTRPRFPGADTSSVSPIPVIAVWREGEAFPVEAPDEGFGIALAGKRGKASFGPSLKIAPRRKADDLPGLRQVKFGVEAGAFGEVYLVPQLRLRGELRKAIGAHKGTTGDLSADFVVRSSADQLVATVGPRVRWGNGRFHRAYFGVAPQYVAQAGLPAFDPGGGIYAYDMTAGAYYSLTPRWGLYGFAGYDRLVGDAARSPVVSVAGDRNQLSAGLAATYRFQVRR